jgi:hypothetical protein
MRQLLVWDKAAVLPGEEPGVHRTTPYEFETTAPSGTCRVKALGCRWDYSDSAVVYQILLGAPGERVFQYGVRDPRETRSAPRISPSDFRPWVLEETGPIE